MGKSDVIIIKFTQHNVTRLSQLPPIPCLGSTYCTNGVLWQVECGEARRRGDSTIPAYHPIIVNLLKVSCVFVIEQSVGKCLQ